MHLGVVLAQVVLGLASVASVAVMIERAMALRSARLEEEKDFAALRDAFRRQDMEAVRKLAAASSGASARALLAGLEHGSEEPEIIREAIAQEVVVQTAHLQSNLVWLATVASTAPYVGLFGTVVGILKAFGTIAATGKTGASIVAGGISEALVTTAFGLAVAIPAVVAYNAFNQRVNALSLLVETHAIDLASRLAPPTSAVHQVAAATPLNADNIARNGAGLATERGRA